MNWQVIFMVSWNSGRVQRYEEVVRETQSGTDSETQVKRWADGWVSTLERQNPTGAFSYRLERW